MTLRTIEEVKKEFSDHGIAISVWAREKGFSPGLVHQVLNGKTKCVRGESHNIAVSLGLKDGVIGDITTLSFGNDVEKPK